MKSSRVATSGVTEEYEEPLSRALFIQQYQSDTAARASEWTAYLRSQEERLSQEIRNNESLRQSYWSDINRQYPASNYMLFSASPHYQDIEIKTKEAGLKRKEALFKCYQENPELGYGAVEEKIKTYIALKPEHYKVEKNLNDLREMLHSRSYEDFARQHYYSIPLEIRNLPDEAQVKKRLIEEYDQKRNRFLKDPLPQIEEVYLKSKSPRYNPALKKAFLEKNADQAFEAYSAAHPRRTVAPTPALIPLQTSLAPTNENPPQVQQTPPPVSLYPAQSTNSSTVTASPTNSNVGFGAHMARHTIGGAVIGGLVTGVRSANPLKGLVRGAIAGAVVGGVSHVVQQKIRAFSPVAQVNVVPQTQNPTSHTTATPLNITGHSPSLAQQVILPQAPSTPTGLNVESTGMKVSGNALSEEAATISENKVDTSRTPVLHQYNRTLDASEVVLRQYLRELTREAEGTEEECRQPHWPGGDSGVTIGRGYDLKKRKEKEAEVRKHLKAIKFPDQFIETLVSCTEVKGGEDAKKKVKELKELKLPDMNLQQQEDLFELTIKSYINTVKRICTDEEGESGIKHGTVDSWETLDLRIKTILVDLTYVGHYTIESREEIQKHVVKNDFEGFKAVLSDEKLWTKSREQGGIFSEGKTSTVAPDRFRRRVEFLNSTNLNPEKTDPLRMK